MNPSSKPEPKRVIPEFSNRELNDERISVTPLHVHLRKADEAASVVHDFIYGLNGVTKKQANDAIWAIHEVLRPLIEAKP